MNNLNFKHLQILPVWQNVDDELPENGMVVDVWIKNEKTGQKLRKPFVKYDKDCFNINLAEGFQIMAWIYINDYAF